jgi:hypothetical protein
LEDVDGCVNVTMDCFVVSFSIISSQYFSSVIAAPKGETKVLRVVFGGWTLATAFQLSIATLAQPSKSSNSQLLH